jgi:hypothetical protein
LDFFFFFSFLFISIVIPDHPFHIWAFRTDLKKKQGEKILRHCWLVWRTRRISGCPILQPPTFFSTLKRSGKREKKNNKISLTKDQHAWVLSLMFVTDSGVQKSRLPLFSLPLFCVENHFLTSSMKKGGNSGTMLHFFSSCPRFWSFSKNFKIWNTTSSKNLYRETLQKLI